jgi:hypothetical protein
MQHQFTKSNGIQCEFIEWDGTNRRGKTCCDLAVKYRRKDGKRFELIKGGCIVHSRRLIMRLCPYHYEQISCCIELQEAEVERQFS